MPRSLVVGPRLRLARPAPAERTATPTRSSTRSTSRASPCATRVRPRCAAPTRGWPTRRPSPTWSTSASPPWSCCPCTRTSRRRSWSSAGLTNYWGYNTIGYFAPHDRYSADVRAGRPAARSPSSRPWSTPCTAPGSRCCSTWCSTTPPRATSWAPRCASAAWTTRPITGWTPGDPRATSTPPGRGNSLNAGDPPTLRLIMDSLRYWVTEMGVDGFRFDLAPTLARQDGGFDQLSAFFDLVSQDPVVSQAKLIAEPWDVGQTDSYDIGRFPPLWREWNGKYRDTDARLLAQPRRSGSATSPPGSPARPTCTGAEAAADRVGQPDHRARRLHAPRPGLLRRQAQRGQRRGQPRRHRRQPVLELRRRGPDRPTPTSWPCGRASAGPCSPR